MATVYLHIGLPKTGTTSIQNFLTDNEDILKQHGIIFPDLGLRYPNVGYRRNAHFMIADYIDENKKHFPDRPCADYDSSFDKIAELAKEYDRIILMDEAIWRGSKKRSDFWPQLKNDFERRNLDLRIIVYFRRQDSYVQSLYAQKIKSDKSYTFYEFLDFLKDVDYPLDFASYMDRLSAIFGKDKLILRVFEKGQYMGPEHNLFSDFLDIFGLTLSDGFEIKNELHNRTLEGTYLEMRRRLNLLPVPVRSSPVLKNSIYDIQRISPYTEKRPKHTLFQIEDQHAFLQTFAESNQRLAKEYLGREDGVLFRIGVEDLPVESLSEEEMLRDTILIYGRALEKLEEINNNLEKNLKLLEKKQTMLEKKINVLEKEKAASPKTIAKKTVKRIIGRK